MADNNINNANNINQNQDGGQGAGDGAHGLGGGAGGGAVHGRGIFGAGPGYVAGANNPFGLGGFGMGGGPGGQQFGQQFGPGGFAGGVFNGNVPFGMGGMPNYQNIGYGVNNFDGNYGANFGMNNPMFGNVIGGANAFGGLGGNVIMGALGNMQHHAGFGPKPGPGTGGRDADGNVFMPNGQYAPGGNITLRNCFAVCGFENNEIDIIMTNIPDFDSVRRLRDESITTMEKNLASGANPFVMQSWRTTLLRGLMHWVQDNERCGRNPMMAHAPRCNGSCRCSQSYDIHSPNCNFSRHGTGSIQSWK